MSAYRCYFIYSCTWLFLLSGAGHASNVTREDQIRREMDCLQQHVTSSPQVTWGDVCYMDNPAVNDAPQGRDEVVNAALDQYDPHAGSTTDMLAQNIQSSNLRQEQDEVEVLGGEWVNEPDQSTRIDYVKPRAQLSQVFQGKDHSQFEIASEFSHYVYKEPSVDVRVRGAMYGLNARYTYRPDDADDIVSMYAAEGRFSFGQVDYQGSGTTNGIDDNVIEVRGLVGKDYDYQGVHLVPYFGFGYRRLYDAGGGTITSTGHYGYDRESRYFYLPFGFDTTIKFPRFTLNPVVEYDWFLMGHQISYLSDVPGYGDIKNRQDGGFGVRMSLRLIKPVAHAQMFIEPFMRYWHIHQSDIKEGVGSQYILTGYEPDNNTKEIGVKMGLQF